MYIPFISIAKQQQIAAHITESFRLREESERLLEQAKVAVEHEIDEMAQGDYTQSAEGGNVVEGKCD
jgi:restriction endonuclease S subunit